MVESLSERVLIARFDPKLRVYEYVNSLLILLFTIIGIPLIPIWLVLGWVWSGRYYRSLRCELDDRHLRVRRGVLFRKSTTIPLDRIQDLTLLDGPIQRALGLCTLRIETAGQSSPQGSADANLTGLMDAEEFQEVVLERRDRLVQQMAGAAHASGTADTAPTHAPGAPEAPRALPAAEEVLVEIRDLLRRLEEHVRVAR